MMTRRVVACAQTSVLESHHLASAFELLLCPEFNFLAAWDRRRYMAFRESVVKLVLATDLSRHIDFVSALDHTAEQLEALHAAEAAGNGRGAAMPADGVLHFTVASLGTPLLLTCAIKAADLGHTVKAWQLHQRWSRAIEAEFFAMGDTERAAGLPISPYCDRQRDELAAVQLGFLGFVCKPFFTAVARLLPAHAIAVQRLENNIHSWRDPELLA